MEKVKRNKRRIIICIICAVLILAIISGIVAWVVISNKDPVILEYEGVRIHRSMYEFLLSRMKGSLYNSRENVTSNEYWSGEYSDGITREEYYNNAILENCKVYAVAASIFDELVKSGEISGLPTEMLEEIEDNITFNIEAGYVADGSEEKLNEMIAEYGVNIDTLREIYTIQAKAQYVQEYIYGGEDADKISPEVKEQFYRENYHRIKQVFVANFYYETIKDEYGNEIYFDGNDGGPLYDYENGEKQYDEKGNYVNDKYGVAIAFDKNGNYLYDTENGIIRYTSDADGNYIKYQYTEAQMKERAELAKSIANISSGNFGEFEKNGKDPNVNTDYSGSFTNSSGIYLSKIESGSYAGYGYIDEMLEKLEKMNVGDIDMVEAEDGYHIFMKYEQDEGAYSESANSKWFVGFNSSLVTKMFLEKCKSSFGDIKINTEIIQKSKSIKEIGINTDIFLY